MCLGYERDSIRLVGVCQIVGGRGSLDVRFKLNVPTPCRGYFYVGRTHDLAALTHVINQSLTTLTQWLSFVKLFHAVGQIRLLDFFDLREVHVIRTLVEAPVDVEAATLTGSAFQNVDLAGVEGFHAVDLVGHTHT